MSQISELCKFCREYKNFANFSKLFFQNWKCKVKERYKFQNRRKFITTFVLHFPSAFLLLSLFFFNICSPRLVFSYFFTLLRRTSCVFVTDLIGPAWWLLLSRLVGAEPVWGRVAACRPHAVSRQASRRLSHRRTVRLPRLRTASTCCQGHQEVSLQIVEFIRCRISRGDWIKLNADWI